MLFASIVGLSSVYLVVEEEEAEGGHPVLDGDDHHLVARGQDLRVVQLQRRRATVEGTAKNPHLDNRNAWLKFLGEKKILSLGKSSYLFY